MTQCGVTGPRSVVLVAHSYGGAIALADAARDPRIAGMVLLDAVVPGVWTEHEVQKNLAAMRPQYEDIRKQAPDLAKVAIPWAEAMPASAREVNALSVPEALPIAEIGAEHGQSDPDSAHTWRAAQLAFVTGHPTRRFTLAEGSSHKVMVDKPDLVVDAVVAMVRRVENDAALQQDGK
jgi:pimeloyl-ACP methyl ester carboxylesterase